MGGYTVKVRSYSEPITGVKRMTDEAIYRIKMWCEKKGGNKVTS